MREPRGIGFAGLAVGAIPGLCVASPYEITEVTRVPMPR
jgi:hypothetical protein